MGRALIAVLAIAPWLWLTPLASSALASVVLGALAVVAACHGAGQVVALATRRVLVDPMLAIAWGLAALIVAGGLLMALRVFSQAPLVGGAAGLHTLIVIRYRALIRMPGIRWSLPWIALLAVVALVHVAGTAGSPTLRPFDDDGHVAGQVARLVQTGTLADAIGYPRTFQLGGNVILGALAIDPRLGVALDRGLLFVLVLAFVCTRIRPTDAATGLWAALVVLVAAAFAFVARDAAPCWSAVLLLVALYTMLDEPTGPADRPATAVPLALLAAALIALRIELAPAAFVGLVGAWMLQPHRAPRWSLVLAAGTLVAIVPFVVTRQLAWAPLDGAAAALLSPKLPSIAFRCAVFAAVLALAAPLLVALTRTRWPPYATAAGIAGVVSELAGDQPYAMRFVWPLVLALALVLVIHLARRAAAATSFVAAVFAVLLVHEGTTARRGLAWTERYRELLVGVEHLRHEPARGRGDHARLLAHVPPGATVATWIAHPEHLDHARHRFIDLRTPRIARYRKLVYGPHHPRLHDLVRGARYLLVEREDHYLTRSQGNVLHRLACAELHAGCADDLELLVLRSPVIASEGNVKLVALPQ